MITNIGLATALNQDRDRRLAERQRLAATRSIETHDIRRSVGRWLEHLGRRLQGHARPSRSSA
jgi:hypothetical protein